MRVPIEEDDIVQCGVGGAKIVITLPRVTWLERPDHDYIKEQLAAAKRRTEILRGTGKRKQSRARETAV